MRQWCKIETIGNEVKKTINEISSEYGVHPTQVVNWKKLLLDGSKDVFSGKNERNMALLTM